MKHALLLGVTVAAVALFANANIASADHCYSGGYGGYGGGYGGYGGGYGTVYSNRGYHSHRGYGYSTRRYATPYYGHSHRYGGYSRSRYYGGSGVYVRGRNFSFGYGY